MNYLMMPMAEHFDGGLGATGEAFEEAAKMLAERAAEMPSSHPHIPINFLHRHAIELFLKSMIVVLHRALEIPYGDSPSDGQPFTAVDGKWQPLHRVHSVGTLWAHVRAIFKTQTDALKARCQTDWQDVPPQLDVALAAIEATDSSSTFFRYPDGRDTTAEAKKSSWKPVDPTEIVEQLPNASKPMKALLLFDAEGEVLQQAFRYDDAPLADLSNQLAEAARLLSGAHTGLRVELAGGF